MTRKKLAVASKRVWYVFAAVALLVTLAALNALQLAPGRLSTPSVTSVSSYPSGQGDAADRVELDMEFDIAWWPAEIVPAARIFQCAPSKLQDARHSLVVWTDTKNEVIAYGAALQGKLPPQYVTPLTIASAQDARRSVHPSAPGFRVLKAQNDYTLALRDIRLDCVPSSDD